MWKPMKMHYVFLKKKKITGKNDWILGLFSYHFFLLILCISHSFSLIISCEKIGMDFFLYIIILILVKKKKEKKEKKSNNMAWRN